ncbi:MAG: VWA domain-containing protein [Acidobacteriota bacterium]
MRGRLLAIGAFAGLAALPLAAGQQPTAPPEASQDQRPRFRGGANLVRVDAYVTESGEAVTDLELTDFEVLEDNIPQRLESFRLVRPRGPVAEALRREPATVAESRQMAAEADARVFVLFMDLAHVQIDGSYRAQGPVTRLLDRTIGQDDLVGVMTPEMSARNLTLARRTATIDGMLRDSWTWGQRNRLNTPDPREREIEACYPDSGETAGLAVELIARRREGKTLDALDDLIVYLEALREERKFVLLLSEGWLLRSPDQQLARTLRSSGRSPGGAVPVGVDPTGRLRLDNDQGNATLDSCERERAMLAFSDHDRQFQDLLQRANRANVSFYPLDARGLVAFDEPIGPRRPPPPSVDAARLRQRHDALRTLAANTDGVAILDTGHIDESLERMVQDAGAYYLLGYYSTNTRLDGRFRRITVRVKRPNHVVRARPGYLAPTEADLASARVDALMNGAPAGHSTTPAVTQALERLASVRGAVPMRVHAAAGRARIWITAELDGTTLKAAEWQQGGTARVRFEHERGASLPIETEVALDAGQRTLSTGPPAEATLAPGRYVVRLQVTPRGGVVPLQTTVDVTIPDEAALMSRTGIVTRRGPSTGREYQPTADPRFRRTERLRFAVPRFAAEGRLATRILGRDGQPLALAVTVTDELDPDTAQRMVVAECSLAALAQGDYILEVTLTREDETETATYGFRVVP